jgi:hypothetical protein
LTPKTATTSNCRKAMRMKMETEVLVKESPWTHHSNSLATSEIMARYHQQKRNRRTIKRKIQRKLSRESRMRNPSSTLDTRKSLER